MHRFRLLDLYVAGIVAAVGLTIGGVSMRKAADDHGARGASAEETAATAMNTKSISVSIKQSNETVQPHAPPIRARACRNFPGPYSSSPLSLLPLADCPARSVAVFLRSLRPDVNTFSWNNRGGESVWTCDVRDYQTA